MKIQKAIVFATLAHEGQCRKGTNIPYIVHPMEVMQILTANGCNETVILAGILHDTLEDTQTTAEDILHNFGQDVLDLVLCESEDKSKSWQERKQATIDHLADASKEIQLICCADKLSNIKSIYVDQLILGDDVFKRFSAPTEKIRWYYESIANALTKIDGYKMKQQYVAYVKAVFSAAQPTRKTKINLLSSLWAPQTHRLPRDDRRNPLFLSTPSRRMGFSSLSYQSYRITFSMFLRQRK